MIIQIFLEDGHGLVLADKRFLVRSGLVPERLQQNIQEMVDSVHNVEEIKHEQDIPGATGEPASSVTERQEGVRDTEVRDF